MNEPKEKLKLLVTLEGPAIEAYKFAKRETGWSNSLLWNRLLATFGMSLGNEQRKLNEKLFHAMVSEAESSRELIRMQIAATKKTAAGKRLRGAPVKIP